MPNTAAIQDYNQQAAFYHVHSSNHAEQASSELDAIAAFIPTAREGAQALFRHFNRTCPDGADSLTFPSHMSPYGNPGAIGPSPIGDLRMRWEGIWLLSAHMWDWECERFNILITCMLLVIRPEGS